VVLAIVPTIAAWGTTQINNALGAAGTNAGKVGMDVLANNGVLYEGLHVLGSGATLVGIILGSICVFIIEGQHMKAAAFSLTGAVLTFFGLMHSEAIGIMKTPSVAAAYFIVAAFLFLCAKRSDVSQPDTGETDPAMVPAE